MSTTTTNFGWTVPSDTDLVKDGAAAIRTALGGVDTSFVDLKGGTTGQVLSKASGTDLDFTWVAQDDSNAIQNAIVDAKGDLIVGASADTPARLAVGTNGHVLTANSSATNGVEWAAPAGGGGLVFIDRQSFSGVSSYSLTNKFSSTYDNYKIQLRITGMTASNTIYARMRSGSTDNTSSNYRSGRVYQLGSGVTGMGDTTGTATYFGWVLEWNAQTSYLEMELTAPYLTAYTGYSAQTNFYYSAYGQHNQIETGMMSVDTSYDGMTFYPSAGNFTGEVYVYGYARS